ncbi:hypothetical protein ACMHYB_29435 [Sorangium sp. So ce1128]
MRPTRALRTRHDEILLLVVRLGVGVRRASCTRPTWNRFLVEQLSPDAKDVQPASLELARLV